MSDPRHTRQWALFAEWVITRDRRICWLCGQPGADTADHIIPIAIRPELCFDPDNVRAAHGEKRTLDYDGYDCIGNYSKGAAAGKITQSIPRREWFGDMSVLAQTIMALITPDSAKFLSPRWAVGCPRGPGGDQRG